MTALPYILLAGLFLPLFPLSMGFNWLLGRCRHLLLRALLLLLWPQAGVLLIGYLEVPLPGWVVPLALASSLLYAFRALALRDLGEWSGFLATSSWALLWIPLHGGSPVPVVQLFALGFSVPLLLLAFLGAGLERRFGAACAGLYGGLAVSIPRFSTILVFVVLAIIATPLFPAFFIMIATIVQAMSAMPSLAGGVAGVWLLWSWSGARLLQGLVTGTPGEPSPPDLDAGVTWGYSLILLLLMLAGIYAMGGMA